MPFGQCCAQRFSDILRLVVNRGVEAKLFHNVVALLGPARDAHHVAAFYLGDLADDGADRAAAPETTTVSPGFGLPISSKPK